MRVLATTRQRVLYEAREIWRNGFHSFDTETTGLNDEDEVIQWAVCDQEGGVLGSGYIKPTVAISEDAFKKHGISEGQLVDAPSFAEVWPTIRNLLIEKTVVIYNANFDIGRLYASARASQVDIPYGLIKMVCAMHLFAEFYGELHEYYGTYTWQSLNEVAIPCLHIEVAGSAHDASHDAAATALIIKKLAELADRELPVGWHPPVKVSCAGCGRYVQECAEPDEIWHCQECSLRLGLFHRCPGCTYHIVESPATGTLCLDICEYCHRALHREKMLLIGAWHYCPAPIRSANYPRHIVETPDLEELCRDCKQEIERNLRWEEAERERKLKWEEAERVREQQRKEARRVYAREYRQRRKERERENAERLAQGLPPLEVETKPEPVDAIINHHGHQFLRRTDEQGRPEVFCLRCEAIWSRPPQVYCAGIKTYRAWVFIPDHLMTRAQLRRVGLKPVKEQKPEAVIVGSFDSYSLYNKEKCVPIKQKKKVRTS
jgi:DNA polymerase-3 subunit epsilon